MYNHDGEDGQSPERQLSKDYLSILAANIGEEIDRAGVYEHVRNIVLDWCENTAQQFAKREVLEDEQEEYAKKAFRDERLRDRDAGPPSDDMEFVQMSFTFKPVDGQGRCSELFDGWRHKSLSDRVCPGVEYLLPLDDSDRKYTSSEKWVVLAAIHDMFSVGARKIGPEDQQDGSIDWGFVSVKADTREITVAQARHLQRMLWEVIKVGAIEADSPSKVVGGQQAETPTSWMVKQLEGPVANVLKDSPMLSSKQVAERIAPNVSASTVRNTMAWKTGQKRKQIALREGSFVESVPTTEAQAAAVSEGGLNPAKQNRASAEQQEELDRLIDEQQDDARSENGDDRADSHCSE